MWLWEPVGTEQEASVSALSMTQWNVTGDTESRLAVSLVVWWLWIPKILQWAHSSPPHTRRLDRNKRCNVVYLTTWIFFKSYLKRHKSQEENPGQKGQNDLRKYACTGVGEMVQWLELYAVLQRT